jgi:fucose permease
MTSCFDRSLSDVRQPTPLYLVSFAITGFALTMIGPSLSTLRDRTGSSIAEIGSLFLALQLGFIVGSVIAGRVLDRFDGHRVYATGFLCVAAALLALPVANSLIALWGVMVAIGTASSISDVSANTLLMWHLGEHVGRAMNLLHFSFGVGALIAPLVVALGVDTAARLGGVIAVVMALWALSVPSPTAPQVRRDEQSTATRRVLVIAAAFFFVYVGVEIGFAGWIHTYAGEVGFSPRAATMITTGFWISFTSGRLFSAWVSGRIRPKVVMTVSGTATVVAAVVLTIAQGSPAGMWVGAIMIGLATAPQFPVMIAYLERRIQLSGSDTSWFMASAGMGGLAFPYAIGQMIDAAGTAIFPWMVLGLSVIAMAAFARANAVLGG